MLSRWIFPVLLLAGPFLFVDLSHSSGAHATQEKMPLHEGLGNHHFRISTAIPMAQRYFDQGMILMYGFNHAESARSFRYAQTLDPSCAMCFWGEALVLGPNINAPMDPAVVPQAWAALGKAVDLSVDISDKEQALIQALSKRYAEHPPQDRSSLDQAYAEAMRGVATNFSQDVVITSLFAEALMDLHPWDFWTKTGEAKPWTAEIVSTLEHALDLNPNNPLANHLYIHAVEASPNPRKALGSAERLPALVPGSGHLVHMPAHIYIRIGWYRQAALANQRAVKIDGHYLSHSHVESIYTAAYVPHNFHFLWAATSKTGQYALALQAAKDTAAKVNREMMRDPAFAGTLQHFSMIPLFTQALFGKWDAVLAEPAPPSDLRYPEGVWHYARGLAFTRKGELAKAEEELGLLRKVMIDPALAQLTIFDLNGIPQILNIAESILAGEIAAAKKDYDTAVKQLNNAVQLEEGLNYTEPKDWYLPPRQVLGAVLLEAGRPQEAEKAFREDLDAHPQNGWTLYGLVQSLEAQKKLEEAHDARQQFKVAWEDADVTLSNARF